MTSNYNNDLAIQYITRAKHVQNACDVINKLDMCAQSIDMIAIFKNEKNTKFSNYIDRVCYFKKNRVIGQFTNGDYFYFDDTDFCVYVSDIERLFLWYIHKDVLTECAYERLNNAATLLQSHFRGWSTRMKILNPNDPIGYGLLSLFLFRDIRHDCMPDMIFKC
jgi:hypothetical protein